MWGGCQAAALGVKSDMGECPLVVCLTISEYVFPAYTLLCIPLASAVEQILILLSWLHVLQGQAKLLITTGVIDQPFWASNVLASGLLAVSLPNASSPYSLQLLCASLHQNLLDFDVWRLIHDHVRSVCKGLHVITQLWGFLLERRHNIEARRDWLLGFRGMLHLG